MELYLVSLSTVSLQKKYLPFVLIVCLFSFVAFVLLLPPPLR